MARAFRITFIGTGLMGAPMARNLMQAGHLLTVWNRTADKAAALVAAGAKTKPTVAEAVAGADVVISMLSDGYATGPMVADPDLRAALGAGTVWIDMSSSKPEHARDNRDALASLGVDYLDAPVSGGTRGAEAGTLAIMVGGEAETCAAMAPVLEAMGRPVHVGPCGSGMLTKLANQTIVAVTIAAVAEATLLAERGGADPAALRQALKGGFADSVILQQHGERMSEGNFVPGGLSRFQLKDLDNVLSEAEALSLELPSTQQVRDRFAHLCEEMAGGDLDHSALFLELKGRNGLS